MCVLALIQQCPASCCPAPTCRPAWFNSLLRCFLSGLLQVDAAYEDLWDALQALRWTITEVVRVEKKADPGFRLSWPKDLSFHTDEINSAVWLKLSRQLLAYTQRPLPELYLWGPTGMDQESVVQCEAAMMADGRPVSEPDRLLRPPVDRNGATHKRADLRTCPYLDERLNIYRGERFLDLLHLLSSCCQHGSHGMLLLKQLSLLDEHEC